MIARLPRRLLVLCLAASLFASAVIGLRPDSGLKDFGSFYMAGETYNRGLDPYGVYPDIAAESGYDFGYTDSRGHSPNLNPPISVYPFSLLAKANAEYVRWALNLSSIALFAACVYAMTQAYPWQRRGLVILCVAAFGGFWYTLWLGQLYVWLFALGLGSWLTLQRGGNPLVIGLLIGLLVAVKPNFAIWPAFLLLTGQPRVAFASVATAGAISVVPLLIDGPAIYRQWLTAAEAYPRIAYAPNASLVGEATRLGVAWVGYGLSATLVAGAAAYVWRAKLTVMEASAWAIVVGLLASPIAWIGYGLLALPVLLSRRWRRWEWIVAIGLADLVIAINFGEPHFLAMLGLLGLLVGDAVAGGRAGATATPGDGELVTIPQRAAA